MNEYELLGKNVPNAAIGSWYAVDARGQKRDHQSTSRFVPHAILG